MSRVLIALLLAGCSAAPEPPATRGELWPEADALFHSDARFIGADGAYSVDLGEGRVLWLFGDSFIANTDKRVRAEARMIRNSVAIQTGYDPSLAMLRYYWQSDADGQPKSFMAEGDNSWFWPGHGVRLGDSLLLFYEELVSPEGDPEGFETTHYTAVRIATPELEPTDWVFESVALPSTGHDIALGEALLVVGDWLYVYGTADRRHSLFVCRFDARAAEQGDLASPSWWGKGGWGSATPESIIDWGQPELSVHFEPRLGRYLMVFTEGYGATTLALRVADAPEGPWSAPRDIMRPPESFENDAFVYAGKAHPELVGADLIASYVPSRFHDVPARLEDRYYYPRFVRITLP